MGYKTRLKNSFLLTIPSNCHSRGMALSLETHEGWAWRRRCCCRCCCSLCLGGHRRLSRPWVKHRPATQRGRALRSFCDTARTAVALKICSSRQHTQSANVTNRAETLLLCSVCTHHPCYFFEHNLIWLCTLRCFEIFFCCQLTSPVPACPLPPDTVPTGRGCNFTPPPFGEETAGRLLPTGGLGVLVWLAR